MLTRLLSITVFSITSTFAFGQASTAPGPVPPAIEQMPDRFQPPVPGCTDCYYTVPSGKVAGAMGTTNNEDVKVTNPLPAPPLISPRPISTPAKSAPAASVPSAAPLSVFDYTDLGFQTIGRAWPLASSTPLPLFIGAAAELSESSLAALTLTSACNLHSIDYTTQAGTPTTIPIPMSLWDVTTKTKLADLPTDWNAWKVMTYPAVSVGKQVPAGHKVQIRLTQPTTLPVNFQFNISIKAHCLKATNDEKTPVAAASTKSAAAACKTGYKPVTADGKTTCVKK